MSEKWVEAEPYNLNAHNELAQMYLLYGKQTQAIDALKKSLEIKAENPSAFILLSDLYRNNNDNEKSFEYTQKAFASKELAIDIKMRILLTYYEWTNHDTLLLEQAYKLIDLLIENHPNDAKTFTIAGDYHYRDANLNKAKKNFLKASGWILIVFLFGNN